MVDIYQPPTYEGVSTINRKEEEMTKLEAQVTYLTTQVTF